MNLRNKSSFLSLRNNLGSDFYDLINYLKQKIQNLFIFSWFNECFF